MLSLKFTLWKKSAISRSFYPIILASFPETIEFHQLESENLWIKKWELYYYIGSTNKFPFNITLPFPLLFQRKHCSDYSCLGSCSYNQFYHFLAKELRKTWNHKSALKDDFSNNTFSCNALGLVRDWQVRSASFLDLLLQHACNSQRFAFVDEDVFLLVGNRTRNWTRISWIPALHFVKPHGFSSADTRTVGL